jgi:hypothetical protein
VLRGFKRIISVCQRTFGHRHLASGQQDVIPTMAVVMVAGDTLLAAVAMMLVAGVPIWDVVVALCMAVDMFDLSVIAP